MRHRIFQRVRSITPGTSPESAPTVSLRGSIMVRAWGSALRGLASKHAVGHAPVLVLSRSVRGGCLAAIAPGARAPVSVLLLLLRHLLLLRALATCRHGTASGALRCAWWSEIAARSGRHGEHPRCLRAHIPDHYLGRGIDCGAGNRRPGLSVRKVIVASALLAAAPAVGHAESRPRVW